MKAIKEYQKQALKKFGYEKSKEHILMFQIKNSFTKKQLVNYIVALWKIGERDTKEKMIISLENYYKSLIHT